MTDHNCYPEPLNIPTPNTPHLVEPICTLLEDHCPKSPSVTSAVFMANLGMLEDEEPTLAQESNWHVAAGETRMIAGGRHASVCINAITFKVPSHNTRLLCFAHTRS